MAPFYGWGSTASMLDPLEQAVYFLPLNIKLFDIYLTIHL